MTTPRTADESRLGLHRTHRGARQERDAKLHVPGYRARRWIVERPLWMNRFTRLLIRWENRWISYLASFHFRPVLGSRSRAP